MFLLQTDDHKYDVEFDRKPRMEYIDKLMGTGKTNRNKNEREFPNAEQDMFYWAVLLNRWELAKLFWRIGKNHIGKLVFPPNFVLISQYTLNAYTCTCK